MESLHCLEFHQDQRGVARIALNRPAVHNAFNLALIQELARCFQALDQDPTVRVIVLEARGKNFSAGADVEWMNQQARAQDEENRATAKCMAEMFRVLDTCSKPVVARVQGAALGGGSGLVCVADLVVAHPGAVFGFTEVRLGILPAVISPFVLRKIGYSQARARFLTGSRFSADEALRIGMVHYVAEALDEKLHEVVSELLQGAPGAQGRCKRLLPQVLVADLATQQEITMDAIAQARSAPEGREGLSAFLEKRPPHWLQGL